MRHLTPYVLSRPILPRGKVSVLGHGKTWINITEVSYLTILSPPKFSHIIEYMVIIFSCGIFVEFHNDFYPDDEEERLGFLLR